MIHEKMFNEHGKPIVESEKDLSWHLLRIWEETGMNWHGGAFGFATSEFFDLLDWEPVECAERMEEAFSAYSASDRQPAEFFIEKAAADLFRNEDKKYWKHRRTEAMMPNPYHPVGCKIFRKKVRVTWKGLKGTATFFDNGEAHVILDDFKYEQTDVRGRHHRLLISALKEIEVRRWSFDGFSPAHTPVFTRNGGSANYENGGRELICEVNGGFILLDSNGVTVRSPKGLASFKPWEQIENGGNVEPKDG